MDWRNIVDEVYLIYNEFIKWYSVQPIYGQVLAIIGIIALLTLAITLIYYVIKGLAYLIFYTLKGIYYLLKGIGLGFFKLCKGFYNLVSGEYKSKKQTYNNNIHIENQITHINRNILYCKECGKRFSEKMMKKIFAQGNVFCVNCGKECTLTELPRLIIPTH